MIVVTENAALGTSYAFEAGNTAYGAQATTPLVARITHGTSGEILPLYYAYDNVGNITTEWQGDIDTHYAYDALGQLIQVVSPFEADAEGNPSLWEYDYDRGGNMLEKRRYRYIYKAQGEQVKSDLLERRVYTYGDANWKDKLTAYDGKPITHDAIGNPLTYDGWTYTWQAGRQLSSMAKSGTNASFKYDASGLRTQKTVNGVVTDYTLHGKLVTGLKQGANIMHFFYDKDSRPQMVAYNGTLYTYVHNLQGDIIAIVDNVGTKVVEYKYDVWGKPIGAPWTLTIAYEALATLNPFRYRGYVWDTETGLYYLRSRYYNPDWGRFINADTLLGRRGGLLSHNLYSYCNNLPIILDDPNGNISSSAVLAIITAGVIGTLCAINAVLSSRKPQKEQESNPHPIPKKPYPFIGKSIAGSQHGMRAYTPSPKASDEVAVLFDSYMYKRNWRINSMSYLADLGNGKYSCVVNDIIDNETIGVQFEIRQFVYPSPASVADFGLFCASGSFEYMSNVSRNDIWQYAQAGADIAGENIPDSSWWLTCPTEDYIYVTDLNYLK